MTYRQTIDYLYQHLPMFSRIGAAAYKADLHNTIALCESLGNPHQKFKSIHIAGTNGKGSTSHMLAAILQQAGYKTGLYTSPHLKDFRERIKINGDMVTEEFVVAFTARTMGISQEIQPSFFELTVAMAFEYFAREKVDIAVIETGLGGRLDSTNVITPILSIITNIGYDHMNILGDTIEAIAAEKAGIIKAHVPVVIGETLPQTKTIFIKKAKELNAPILFANEEYEVSDIVISPRSLSCNARSTAHNCTESFVLDLNGSYQTKNLCSVLCAEGILKEQGFIIKNADEKFAYANSKKLTGLFGRWDLIREAPALILDVAHNEDGIREVVGQLAVSSGQLAVGSRGKIRFVLGLVRDKDISKILSLLPKDAVYYFTNAHIPRAMPCEELREKAVRYGLQGTAHDDVNAAIKIALNNSTPDDTILVCGSVFVVGEVNAGLFANEQKGNGAIV